MFKHVHKELSKHPGYRRAIIITGGDLQEREKCADWMRDENNYTTSKAGSASTACGEIANICSFVAKDAEKFKSFACTDKEADRNLIREVLSLFRIETALLTIGSWTAERKEECESYT